MDKKCWFKGSKIRGVAKRDKIVEIDEMHS